jgi:hypothetical protein
VTRRVSLALFLCLVSSLARAQDAAVGSSFSPTHLRDLPASENVFSLLEVSEGEVISDRFYGGGLNTGQQAHDGAFLSSWTQTQFFVGDVNVTMPNGGVPFLFPTATPWDRVDVASALMPAGVNAPGLAVSLQPARPASTWTRVIDASGAGSGLVASPSTNVAPPIETLRNWSHGGLFVSGPLSPRVGLVADVEWSGSSQVDRTAITQADGQAASAFANLVFTPNAANEVRTLGWVQRTQAPFAAATAAGQPLGDQSTFTHIQSTWERHATDAMAWRLFGSYSQADGSRSGSFPIAFAIERMLVGPVPLLVDSGNRTDRDWSGGARMTSLHGRHTVLAGADAGRASARIGPGYAGSISEAVDGKQARVWQYANNGRDANRHATTLTAFVSDRMAFGPGRSLELGVGYDGVNGAADGADTGIAWHSVLPRLSFRWKQSEASHFTWIAGYRRSADRLTLDTLAVGDPAAPYAAVRQWTPAGVGPIVMRVGPGTGGVAGFSAIDPSLRRPLTDEIVAGIDAQLSPNIRGRITGVVKEVRNLYDLVDIGAPASSYTTSYVVDGRPEADGGDVLLPVYNRIPATFGADRYLLTNRTNEDTATAAAVVLNSDASLKRLTLMFNATASITDGPAASRGFHADENNLGSLGELSIDPNAATSARGRLFYDRAFTMKISAVYRFPGDFTLGAIARYQDGQPFSRVTVVQDLNQGTEFVRAYPAGDARFKYTGTLDMRLQKRMRLGATALAIFVDAYNLANMGNEVEERVVTGGTAFRDITAIQPPLMVHVGLRFQF